MDNSAQSTQMAGPHSQLLQTEQQLSRQAGTSRTLPVTVTGVRGLSPDNFTTILCCQRYEIFENKEISLGTGHLNVILTFT